MRLLVDETYPPLGTSTWLSTFNCSVLVQILLILAELELEWYKLNDRPSDLAILNEDKSFNASLFAFFILTKL